jgi:glycine/D-amino acid oxidase-like deaminating enzyme
VDSFWFFNRAQSLRFGTQILTETVTRVDFSRRPFRITTDARTVCADTVIVATGRVTAEMSRVMLGLPFLMLHLLPEKLLDLGGEASGRCEAPHLWSSSFSAPIN